MDNGIRCHAESPDSRRGLLLGRHGAPFQIEAPDANPGAPGRWASPAWMCRAAGAAALFGGVANGIRCRAESPDGIGGLYGDKAVVLVSAVRGAHRQLDRLGTAFTRADPDALVHRKHEDLAVTDLTPFARAAAIDDRGDRGFDKVIVDRDLELHLAEQVYGYFMAAIGLGMAALAAKALNIEHREAEDLNLRERLFDTLEFVGLDDGNDELHSSAFRILAPSMVPPRAPSGPQRGVARTM